MVEWYLEKLERQIFGACCVSLAMAAIVLWTFGLAPALAQVSGKLLITHDAEVPLRDGVRLEADIFRPSPETTPGPLPTLLMVTPYNRKSVTATAERWAGRGYAVVLVDSRGTFGSGGEYTPYINEGRDAFDTQEWIARQDWSDGKIGMFGKSYPAFTQVFSAAYGSPHLKAIVPASAQADNFSQVWYTDGLLHLGIAFRGALLLGGRINTIDENEINWMEMLSHLPLRSALDQYGLESKFVADVLEHSTYDDFWRAISVRGRYQDMDVPALHMTGWYDDNIHETIANFTAMRAQSRSEHARKWQRMVIGPWGHHNHQLWNVLPGLPAFDGHYGAVDFGPNAGLDALALHDRWYDYHLKGIDNGLDDEPPIMIFVMGANVWRGEREWPLARTEYQRLYLRGATAANSRWGGGRLRFDPPEEEEPDTYRYDPRNPVPTYGGNQCCTGSLTPDGPLDQRAIQSRPDVLVYDTEPLEADIEITGEIRLNLHFSTNVEDTDFFAAVSDVYPDGRAILIAEGGLRARFRNSIEHPGLLIPGDIYEVEIPLWETSNLFRVGHRIRLHITSSNFPHFDRNLNSATMPTEGTEDDIRVATQIILHDQDNPSSLVIPVIPK